MSEQNWIRWYGAAVRDPYDRYRAVLDPLQARGLDAAATEYGATVAEKSTGDLLRERAEAERELTAPLDFEAAGAAKDAHRGMEATFAGSARAEEAVLLAQGKVRAAGRRDPALDAALAAAEQGRKSAHQREMEAFSAYEYGGLRYDADGNLDVEGYNAMTAADTYHQDWLYDNRIPMRKIVAIEREIALRDELEALEARGALESDVPLDVHPKEVGTEASRLLAERELQYHGWNTLLDRPRTAEIERSQVEAPPLFDSRSDSLGSRRRAFLTEQAAPLMDWLGKQHDRWVRGRLDELTISGFSWDPADSRRALMLETKVAMATGDRDLARSNAAELVASDPERAAVEERVAAGAQAKLDGYQSELDAMREQGTHPDIALAAMRDEDLVYQAYCSEREIRRRMDVASGVERALLEGPSERVVAKLGAEPEKGTAKHAEYQDLAREIETRHLDRISAEQQGGVEVEYDRGPGATLDRRVDAYRAEAGMPGLHAGTELAIRDPGPGIGAA